MRACIKFKSCKCGTFRVQALACHLRDALRDEQPKDLSLNIESKRKQMSTAEILGNREYKYGWVTDIESETIPRGLTEDTVRLISAKKDEPEWLLEFRLKAYRNWLTMVEPRNWPNIVFPEVDYQDMIYYSAPKQN